MATPINFIIKAFVATLNSLSHPPVSCLQNDCWYVEVGEDDVLATQARYLWKSCRPYTITPQPYTITPQPYTINPQPYAINPQPCTTTLNPTP